MVDVRVGDRTSPRAIISRACLRRSFRFYLREFVGAEERNPTRREPRVVFGQNTVAVGLFH